MNGLGYKHEEALKDKNCVDGRTLTYTWSGAEFCWNRASGPTRSAGQFCWDDVSLLLKVRGKSTGNLRQNFGQLSEEEKDHFITLTCKVKGYDETTETKKKVEQNLTVKDIEFTINEVLKSMNVKVRD